MCQFEDVCVERVSTSEVFAGVTRASIQATVFGSDEAMIRSEVKETFEVCVYVCM
jgi:hypothetical protein